MAVDDGNPADTPGTASHAAHAAASAAVRTPEFQTAAAQAHGSAATVDEPQVEVEDVPAETADPEGPSPSSAPTSDDVDEPEVADDYDPEEFAEGFEEPVAEDRAQATDATTAVPAVSDEERIWGQYKTESERKKALAETKRYAANLARELKALKAKPAEAAPAPQPPANPEVESRKVLDHLYETNPAVKAEVTRLGQIRNVLAANNAEIKTLRTAITENDKALNRATYRLEDLQADLKADPENFELQQKVARTEREIEKLDIKRDRDQTKLIRIESETDRADDAWRLGRDNLNNFVASHTDRVEKAKAGAKTFEVNRQKAADEWEATLPTVLDGFKLTEKEYGKEGAAQLREDIRIQVLQAAATFFHHNPDGRIADVPAWIKDQVTRITKTFDLVRGSGSRAYVQARKADAAVPAPRGAAAVAKAAPAEGQRLTAKDMDRVAREQMRTVRISR